MLQMVHFGALSVPGATLRFGSLDPINVEPMGPVVEITFPRPEPHVASHVAMGPLTLAPGMVNDRPPHNDSCECFVCAIRGNDNHSAGSATGGAGDESRRNQPTGDQRRAR